MSKIIDRAGSGASITAVENDANLDSLHGINQVIAGATHTVDITDQGDTLEFTNAGAVAVTLDDIGTIQGAAHTSDFHVTLIATNAATVVTITPDATDSINTGVATIVLTVDEYVTLETDSTGAIWNIINSSDASQVGGLSASQFLRSDTNDTATGDLDFTGAVDLQGTWEIGSVQVTSTAADINDLVDKSSAQTITEEKTFDANIEFDSSVSEKRINFDTGLNRSYFYGSEIGVIGLYDQTNSRAVFFYEPAADTFTARNLNALNAVLTTPVLTNATGSLNGVTGSLLDTEIIIPAFSALTNSTTAVGISSTKIAFANEIFDKTADYDTVLSRFTPDEAGVYRVYAQVAPVVVGSDRFFMRIYKNGASHFQKTTYLSDTFSTAETANIDGLVELNGTTDYVEIFALRSASLTSASVNSSTTGNYFQAHKVSA